MKTAETILRSALKALHTEHPTFDATAEEIKIVRESIERTLTLIRGNSRDAESILRSYGTVNRAAINLMQFETTKRAMFIENYMIDAFLKILHGEKIRRRWESLWSALRIS